MCIIINVITSCADIPDYMTARDKSSSLKRYAHLPTVRICNPWLTVNKAEVQTELQSSWSFRDEIAIIDRITIKVIRIIVPASLQNRALHQLHSNHLSKEKTRLLTCKSIWVYIAMTWKTHLETVPYSFISRQHDIKTMSHKIPGWPWKSA